MALLHILVLAFNNFETTTKPCIASLVDQAKLFNIPLSVLDNGSLDDFGMGLKNFSVDGFDVHKIFSDKNLGFAGGMNELAKAVSTEWLMLVGNDTVFPSDFLQSLLTTLQDLPSEIGIVGPLTNEAGNSQKIECLALTASQTFRYFETLISNPFKQITEIYRADFFCVLIRKNLWDLTNGLDRSYGLGYYEDFDFCMQARQLGFKTVALENLFVFHKGSQSFKTNPLQKKIIKKNKKIFQKKFPKAELRHQRYDNFKVIESYLKYEKSRIEDNNFKHLLLKRLKMLQESSPRSFWKRWIWRRKVDLMIQKVKSYFGLSTISID